MSHVITVYGFRAERMFKRRTCMIDIVLSEIDGLVNISLKAEALANNRCLHRDNIPTIALETSYFAIKKN